MTLVSDFGITTGNPDNTPALQAALNAGYRTFHFAESGTYTFLDTVVIPQGSRVTFTGAGYGMTSLRLSSATGRALFKYFRPPAQPMAIATFENLIFSWAGATGAAGSKAITFCGSEASVSDSWIRVENCMFYSFEVCLEVAYATMNHFIGNWHAFNTYSYILGRGASFTHFTRVFSFDKNFIYARDDIDDAFSNGLFIDQCSAITAQGCNMFVKGWQAIFISKCGFDLGSADNAALWFKNCQDVSVSQCFISSDGSAARDGVIIDQTHTFAIRDNTIVNNVVGVRVIPPAVFFPSNGTICGNTFEGNRTNDVLLMNGCKGVKIKDGHHKTQMSRTGTNYEIYGNLPGVDRCHVKDNTLKGSQYPIVMGSASIISDNIFGVSI